MTLLPAPHAAKPAPDRNSLTCRRLTAARPATSIRRQRSDDADQRSFRGTNLTRPPTEYAPPDAEARGFFGHPRGLATLFFTEMWERFSYYGMRAFLILYMVHALNFDDKHAGSVYGTYTASAWALAIFGGIIADGGSVSTRAC